MSKTVTTRRVIRPSGGVDAPHVNAPQPPSAALQPLQRPSAPPKTTLWGSWQARLATMERHLAANLPADLTKIRTAPSQPDLAEARRLQALYVDPWSGLVDTFDASSSTTDLPDQVLRDYRQYLALRAATFSTLVKRCLAPSEQNQRLLEAASSEVERFIAARRTG